MYICAIYAIYARTNVDTYLHTFDGVRNIKARSFECQLVSILNFSRQITGVKVTQNAKSDSIRCSNADIFTSDFRIRLHKLGDPASDS